MMFNAPFDFVITTNDDVLVVDKDGLTCWSVNVYNTTQEQREEWVEWAEYLVRVLNQRRDDDVAIGEHAFRAGWDACYSLAIPSSQPNELAVELEAAWSEYDPPEELKGL